MTADAAIQAAVERLRAGGLVAIPTETVYGLAGDALNPLAIRRIYATKGRPAGHPVIVHLGPTADPEAWGDINRHARDLIDAWWPGPLTLIVKKHPRVPDEVTGGLDTVGLRMPAHPRTQALLTAFGSGLAAPSANRFGRVSPTTAAHVNAEFGDGVMVLDGGPCTVGIESTIVDTTTPRPALLRTGSILRSDVEAIVGPLGASKTRAPGTLKSHYAPMTSLLLSDSPLHDQVRLEAEGLSVALLRASSPSDYAKNLYSELRRLDALGVDMLIAERAPQEGLGEAINDRLSRAACSFSTEE